MHSLQCKHNQRQKKVIFIKEWFENGIVLMSHLVNFNGTFLCFDDFKRKCPNLTRTSALLYEGAIKAVRDYLSVEKIVQADSIQALKQKHGFILKKEINQFNLYWLGLTQSRLQLAGGTNSLMN